MRYYAAAGTKFFSYSDRIIDSKTVRAVVTAGLHSRSVVRYYPQSDRKPNLSWNATMASTSTTVLVTTSSDSVSEQL